MRHIIQTLGIDPSPSSIVDIDLQMVDRFAARLRLLRHSYSPPKWDDPKFWDTESSRSTRTQYIAVGNSINFRFWSLDGSNFKKAGGRLEGEYFAGAMYMWRCLRRTQSVRRLPILEAQFLAEITPTDFRHIFADDDGLEPLAVGIEERLANLRNLGQVLADQWDGCFSNLIEEAGGSLTRYASLMRGIRAFDDQMHKLTMVNAIMLTGSGLATFDAMPFPGIDYQLLKQLLRQGLLHPNQGLSAKLRNRQALTSEEGYELRRTALQVFVRLEELTAWNGQLMDNLWWYNRINCTDNEPVCLTPKNSHRCPFVGACSQRVSLQAPIEMTRYY
jgi:hypothetical protein